MDDLKLLQWFKDEDNVMEYIAGRRTLQFAGFEVRVYFWRLQQKTVGTLSSLMYKQPFFKVRYPRKSMPSKLQVSPSATQSTDMSN